MRLVQAAERTGWQLERDATAGSPPDQTRYARRLWGEDKEGQDGEADPPWSRPPNPPRV